MERFLESLANKMVSEYGTDLSSHTLVFPNRRSSLFFTYYLGSVTDKPLWAPSMMTINDLLTFRSPLRKAEPLALMFDLYDLFSSFTGDHKTFDDFYFWGEMLLSDFDDIDRYMADASSVFQNISDLKEIDDVFGGLDDEVIEIIRRFWTNFDHSVMTVQKEEFISVWSILGRVYDGFRQRLRQKGIGYEGMIIRDLAERIQAGADWPVTGVTYHFVGFNALNRCEEIILRYMKRKGMARFYWDFDNHYIRNEKDDTGLFLRENIRILGDDMGSEISHDNLPPPGDTSRDWQIISAPSDVAQAKLVPLLMDEMLSGDEDPDKVAVVLADERLLMPLLSSVPAQVKDINVTMGYPFFQTPVYSLVNHLLRLRKNSRNRGGEITFFHTDVINILRHQYISLLLAGQEKRLAEKIISHNMVRVKSALLVQTEAGALIFGTPGDPGELNGYLREIVMALIPALTMREETLPDAALQTEYAYTLLTALNQLGTILDDSSIAMGADVYGRVLDKMMRRLIVPFAGEPLKGLQVMGLLETRNIDFENLIILSANEGVLPGTSQNNSYIPQNLRKAFGLNGNRHKDAIYAYYFFRLLHRAKRIRFVYNSNTSGLRTGEMSRFLLRLKYGELGKPVFSDSSFTVAPVNRFMKSISRTEEINDIIREKFTVGGNGRGLSPSAVNTWIDCSMKFYYSYIAGIREPETLLSEVDSPLFGTILHDVMKELYEPWIGKVVDRHDIEDILAASDSIMKKVNRQIGIHFMHNPEAEIEGRNIIVAAMIHKLVKRILSLDVSFAPLRIVALEKRFEKTVKVAVAGKTVEMVLSGTIDRIDSTGGVTRVLDYKSGSDKLDMQTAESLIAYNSGSRNSAAFQTLLYCEICYGGDLPGPFRPSLYPVRQIFSDTFSDIFLIKKGESAGLIHDYDTIRPHFTSLLDKVLSDIADPEYDFVMTENSQKCRYCPYASVCERNVIK
jgi:hypothetical protein